VPYRVGEGARLRHYRRLDANLGFQASVEKWCKSQGFDLRITNNGHHWQLTKDHFLAEWWPSSAKLVLNKEWDQGIHCHDYKQALAVIGNAYKDHLRNK
jgi:hypothetical protein